MKRILAAAAFSAAGLAAAGAQANTMAYLASQGFQVQSVVRYGIDGEREIYMQRGDALFICFVQVVAADRRVIEQGCRQLSPSPQ